jgi:ribonuclease H / adenosylcobalamin/alpha-ribazole phosphatase
VSRTILLARHGTHAEVGRVLSGRSEIALDDRGWCEAAALAEMVGGMAVASLHSSPRHRTRQTAAPVSARLRLPLAIAPALDEIDFGTFAGRAFAELDGDRDWQAWNGDRARARCPGGETMAEAVARAAAYLTGQPADAYPLLAITHCDIIRGLAVQATGRRFDDMFAIACDPGSLTTFRLAAGGQVELVSLNLRPG